MRFKLDENVGKRAVDLFIEFGHEVETVLDEKLSGAADTTLFEACTGDRRCLVSLDLDFADVLRFPPDYGSGIAVLRLPKGASLGLLRQIGPQPTDGAANGIGRRTVVDYRGRSHSSSREDR